MARAEVRSNGSVASSDELWSFMAQSWMYHSAAIEGRLITARLGAPLTTSFNDTSTLVELGIK